MKAVKGLIVIGAFGLGVVIANRGLRQVLGRAIMPGNQDLINKARQLISTQGPCPQVVTEVKLASGGVFVANDGCVARAASEVFLDGGMSDTDYQDILRRFPL